MMAMKMRALPALIAIAVLAAGCASGGRGLPTPPAGLDLGGEWKLTSSATERFTGGDEQPGAGRGTVIRGGGTRGGSGGPRIRSGGAGLQASAPPETFTLTQTDSVVRFAFQSKRSVSVPTNGRKVSTDMWPGVEQVELRATWTERGLRLDRSTPGGPVVTEIYTRSPGSDVLIVTVELSTPMGKRQFDRTYSRVE